MKIYQVPNSMSFKATEYQGITVVIWKPAICLEIYWKYIISMHFDDSMALDGT